LLSKIIEIINTIKPWFRSKYLSPDLAKDIINKLNNIDYNQLNVSSSDSNELSVSPTDSNVSYT